MTIFPEKISSLKRTREFLESLLDRKKTPRVPKEIRRQAYWCLRHFPHEYDIKIKNEQGKWERVSEL